MRLPATIHRVICPPSASTRAPSAPFRPGAPGTGKSFPACRALEKFMVTKLDQMEKSYKELQVKMSQPDIAANPDEFVKLNREAAALQKVCDVYTLHKANTVEIEVRIYIFVQ